VRSHHSLYAGFSEGGGRVFSFLPSSLPPSAATPLPLFVIGLFCLPFLPQNNSITVHHTPIAFAPPYRHHLVVLQPQPSRCSWFFRRISDPDLFKSNLLLSNPPKLRCATPQCSSTSQLSSIAAHSSSGHHALSRESHACQLLFNTSF
jgi:hypothetical protein